MERLEFDGSRFRRLAGTFGSTIASPATRFDRWLVVLMVCVLAVSRPMCADDPICRLEETGRFPTSEARQAVAVDEMSLFAITNTAIGQYDRQTGEPIRVWKAGEDLPLVHLNSGIVRDGRLYCAHSNYPHIPPSSSIEVWDAATLEHIDSHSLGLCDGSLTWIDWKDDSWWAVFAHYSKQADDDARAKGSRWTSLVRFDSEWRRQAGWVFPATLIERFEPYSCSGGAWGPDGLLYCTGHDHREVYRLQLPQSGSTLRWIDTIPAPFTGQGIAWGPDGRSLYGIDRPRREVVTCRWSIQVVE